MNTPYIFPAGGTNATIYLFAQQDNTAANPGNPATGIAYNDSGLTASYVRPAGSRTAITLGPLTAVNSVHSDGGFIEIDAANMPGLYRFDLPDAVIARGESTVIVQVAGTSAVSALFAPVILTIDPNDDIVESSVVANAANSTTSFYTNLSDADDVHNRKMIKFVSGSLAGEWDRITDYANTNGVIYVGAGFTATPSSDDSFLILNQ